MNLSQVCLEFVYRKMAKNNASRVYVSCIQKDTGRKDKSGETLKHVPYMVSYMRDGNGGCMELKKAVAAHNGTFLRKTVFKHYIKHYEEIA